MFIWLILALIGVRSNPSGAANAFVNLFIDAYLLYLVYKFYKLR